MINLHSAATLPTPPQISESEFAAIEKETKNRYAIVEVTPNQLELIVLISQTKQSAERIKQAPLEEKRLQGKVVEGLRENITKCNKALQIQVGNSRFIQVLGKSLGKPVVKIFGGGIGAVFESKGDEAEIKMNQKESKGTIFKEKTDIDQLKDYQKLQSSLLLLLKTDISNVLKLTGEDILCKDLNNAVLKMPFLKEQANGLYKVENSTFDNWPHHRSIKESIDKLINDIDGKLGVICNQNLDTEILKCNHEQAVCARNVILYLKADHLLINTERQRQVLRNADRILN